MKFCCGPMNKTGKTNSFVGIFTDFKPIKAKSRFFIPQHSKLQKQIYFSLIINRYLNKYGFTHSNDPLFIICTSFLASKK